MLEYGLLKLLYQKLALEGRSRNKKYERKKTG